MQRRHGARPASLERSAAARVPSPARPPRLESLHKFHLPQIPLAPNPKNNFFPLRSNLSGLGLVGNLPKGFSALPNITRL